MRDIYRLLHDEGADVVLTGHAHFYERFARQDADGNTRDDGVRQFVVGTGGRDLITPDQDLAPNSQVRIAHSFGVLKMTLGAKRYWWRYVATPGSPGSDSGSTACH